MRVLIGCEESGIVRDAFRQLGHDAYSCDVKPSRGHYAAFHIQGDILEVIADPFNWHLAIFHPPCTFLCNSGIHRNKGNARRQAETVSAIAFAETLWNAPIYRIALENPIGVLSTRSKLGKPHQIIQPFQFGEDASKATCLWLRNLPRLRATGFAPPRRVGEGSKDLFGEAGAMRWKNQTDSGQNKLPPSPERGALRSITYQGVALAMARQWGNIL